MADLDVSPEALTTHAAAIETLMDAVREAAAYGDQTFDVRAFGLIGSSWSWVLKAWCDDAKNLVDATADSGLKIAEAVTEMAQSYSRHDSDSARVFSQIGSVMGPVAPGGAS